MKHRQWGPFALASPPNSGPDEVLYGVLRQPGRGLDVREILPPPVEGKECLLTSPSIGLPTRSFHRPQQGTGLVHALLILAFWIGVGDNARSCLNIGTAAMHDHGANGDAGVEIAGIVGIKDCSAIDATPNRLEFFNDLHGANFGSTAERTCGKTGSNRVECVELAAKLT